MATITGIFEGPKHERGTLQCLHTSSTPVSNHLWVGPYLVMAEAGASVQITRSDQPASGEPIHRTRHCYLHVQVKKFGCKLNIRNLGRQLKGCLDSFFFITAQGELVVVSVQSLVEETVLNNRKGFVGDFALVDGKPVGLLGHGVLCSQSSTLSLGRPKIGEWLFVQPCGPDTISLAWSERRQEVSLILAKSSLKNVLFCSSLPFKYKNGPIDFTTMRMGKDFLVVLADRGISIINIKKTGAVLLSSVQGHQVNRLVGLTSLYPLRDHLLVHEYCGRLFRLNLY